MRKDFGVISILPRRKGNLLNMLRAIGTAQEVAKRARRYLDDHTGFLARLGKSDEAVRQRLEAAKRGSTFLRLAIQVLK